MIQEKQKQVEAKKAAEKARLDAERKAAREEARRKKEKQLAEVTSSRGNEAEPLHREEMARKAAEAEVSSVLNFLSVYHITPLLPAHQHFIPIFAPTQLSCNNMNVLSTGLAGHSTKRPA